MVLVEDEQFIQGVEVQGEQAAKIVAEPTYREFPVGEDKTEKRLVVPLEMADAKKRSYTPNAKSRKMLIKKFGEDTVHWTGNTIILYTVKKDVFGKEKDVIYVKE